MLITEITSLDKRRSKVLLDESFTFVLYNGEIRHYQLEVGKEIGQECFDEIMNSVLIKRAKARSLYLIKATDRTQKQLYDKLKEGYYPEIVIEAVLSYLKGYHYIDDERYARNYVRVHGKQKNLKQLTYALRQKGIKKEFLEDILEETPIDEEAQIIRWLTKKRYHPEDATYEEKQKLGISLVRKGFDFDNVKRLLENHSNI